MTSKERFEAEFVKLGGELLDLRTKGAGYLYTDIARAFGLWQAAERDMLERCVAVCKSRITPGTGSHAILMGTVNEMKEILNEQH